MLLLLLLGQALTWAVLVAQRQVDVVAKTNKDNNNNGLLFMSLLDTLKDTI